MMARTARTSSWMLGWVLLLGPPAHAITDAWADLCGRLDAVKEGCEALYGNGDSLCEAIGAVEETCDPEEEDGEDTDADEEDSSSTAASRKACDACDVALGEANQVCRGLDALADGECDDEDDNDDNDDAARRAPAADARSGEQDEAWSYACASAASWTAVGVALPPLLAIRRRRPAPRGGECERSGRPR